MKAHLFDAKNPVPIIKFLATFKLTRVTSKIHEGTAMWTLPQFVKEIIANSLNTRMCAENQRASLTAIVRYNETRRRKLLRSYSKAVNYMLKKYATDAVITKYDATTLRYMQPASMTFNNLNTI